MSRSIVSCFSLEFFLPIVYFVSVIAVYTDSLTRKHSQAEALAVCSAASANWSERGKPEKPNPLKLVLYSLTNGSRVAAIRFVSYSALLLMITMVMVGVTANGLSAGRDSQGSSPNGCHSFNRNWVLLINHRRFEHAQSVSPSASRTLTQCSHSNSASAFQTPSCNRKKDLLCITPKLSSPPPNFTLLFTCWIWTLLSQLLPSASGLHNRCSALPNFFFFSHYWIFIAPSKSRWSIPRKSNRWYPSQKNVPNLAHQISRFFFSSKMDGIDYDTLV